MTTTRVDQHHWEDDFGNRYYDPVFTDSRGGIIPGARVSTRDWQDEWGEWHTQPVLLQGTSIVRDVSHREYDYHKRGGVE